MLLWTTLTACQGPAPPFAPPLAADRTLDALDGAEVCELLDARERHERRHISDADHCWYRGQRYGHAVAAQGFEHGPACALEVEACMADLDSFRPPGPVQLCTTRDDLGFLCDVTVDAYAACVDLYVAYVHDVAGARCDRPFATPPDALLVMPEACIDVLLGCGPFDDPPR